MRQFILVLGLIGLSLSACDDPNYEHPAAAKKREAQAQSAQNQSASAQMASQNNSEILLVLDAEGEHHLEIFAPKAQLKLVFQGQELNSRLSGDKRKYEQGGQTVAEVKFSDQDKFKVRTADGSLLWKVKLDERKVKISDNEENNNPYEIKLKEDKIKVYDGQEQEIGQLKYKADKQLIEVWTGGNLQFTIGSDKLSGAYAPLIMPKISARDQAILVGELLAKGF